MAFVKEKEFKKYVAIQKSGETNMFDIAYVMKATGISKEQVTYIMQHYAALEEVYGAAESPRTISAMEAVREAMKAANEFMAEKDMEISDGDELIVVFDNATFKITVAGQELKLHLNLLEAIYVPAVIGISAGDEDE